MTNLPFTLPAASGASPLENLSRVALLATLNDQAVRQEIENMAGLPVFVEADDGAGGRMAALNFGGLAGFLGKLGPLLGALLPAIIGIVTGGFSPAAIAALLQALVTIFGPGSSTGAAASRALAAIQPGVVQP